MDALEKITGLNNVVAIAGDSWSMGEWFPFKDGDLYAGWVPALSHRSPEIYLHQAYDNLRIYHFGRQGDNNAVQANILLEQSADLDFAIVYWTCPSRDLLIPDNNHYDHLDLPTLTLEQYEKQCSEFSKIRLETLQKCDVPILLVGGHVSLPDVSEYSNLIPVVDRMTNLVDEPFWDDLTKKPKAGSLHNKLDYVGMLRLDNVDDNFDLPFQLRNSLIEKIDNNGLKETLNPKYFPDQGHGNRLVHKLTIDKIVEYIDNNNMINTIVN